MAKRMVYAASNPWPKAETVADSDDEVVRCWSVRVRKEVDNDDISDMENRAGLWIGKVAISVGPERDLKVRIRHPHPDIADRLAVMIETSRVLKEIDSKFGILDIQGVPRDKWLLLR